MKLYNQIWLQTFFCIEYQHSGSGGTCSQPAMPAKYKIVPMRKEDNIEKTAKRGEKNIRKQ